MVLEAWKVERSRRACYVYDGAETTDAAKGSSASELVVIATPVDEANRPIAKQVQSACHDTLPWLLSFS